MSTTPSFHGGRRKLRGGRTCLWLLFTVFFYVLLLLFLFFLCFLLFSFFSYYTVSHLLQGENNVDGSVIGPLGIRAEELTNATWDYIFLKGLYPATGCLIPEEKLQQCRNEFEFWYPMDLRVSGKDLVRNHLTMCLYNHAAIWEGQPEKWPRSFFTNGHVMVDNQKVRNF